MIKFEPVLYELRFINERIRSSISFSVNELRLCQDTFDFGNQIAIGLEAWLSRLPKRD